MNLDEIAIKMIKNKYTPNPKYKEIIFSDTSLNYPSKVNYILNELDVEYDEDKKYKLYKAFFDPIEKKNNKELYTVEMMIDPENDNIIFSCIYVKKDCCSKEHDLINFKLNVK